MCGRFARYADPERVRRAFELSETPRDLIPRYHIAPSQEVAAVRAAPDGGRALVRLRWGLVPPWARGPGGGTPMIDARAETAHPCPAVRRAPARRRCLVPFPPERLAQREVGPAINAPRREGPDLIRPA